MFNTLEYFEVCLYFCLKLVLRLVLFLQGHTALYRSSPPLPDVMRPSHLLPTVHAKPKVSMLDLDPLSDTESEDDVPLTDKSKKAQASNVASPKSSSGACGRAATDPHGAPSDAKASGQSNDQVSSFAHHPLFIESLCLFLIATAFVF